MRKITKVLFLIFFSQKAIALNIDNSLKLEGVKNFETINEIELQRFDCSALSKVTKEKPRRKPKLAHIEKVIGPLWTGVKYDPISSKASIAFQLDLIDCYILLKSKPDYQRIIPYALRGIKQDLHTASEHKNKVIAVLKDFFQSFMPKKDPPIDFLEKDV